MKKMELNHSLFEEIPTPIIWDILSRLPTKACLSCKLVCKDWYCIIVDPHFAVTRLSRGCYATLLLRGEFYDRRLKFVLLELDKPVKVDESDNLSVSDDSIIRFKSKFSHIKKGKLSLVNECNGIICLKSYSGPVVVCNLLRGKYVSVEQPRRIGYCGDVYGLGCCPETHQYKLLRVLESNNDCVAEVQTLGSNDWRIVGDAPDYDPGIETPTFFNGSLYWFSARDNCVRSFHFGTEQFSHIELPEERSDYCDIGLCVFDSSVCVSCESGDINQSCDIWVMKQYGVKESWVKQYVFQKTSGLVMPIFQKDIEEQMLLTHRYDDYGLAVGDNKSGMCKKVSVLGVSAFETVTFNANFSESLIFNRR